MAALVLLTVPLQWIVAAVTAALIHELCHIAVIDLCGGSVYALRIVAGGIRIDTEYFSGWREFLSAAAGPIGSFLLLLFAHIFPRLALCGAMQGVYNLIPLFPLDGGRMLHGLITCHFSQAVAEKATKLIGLCSIAVLAVALICFCRNIVVLLVLFLFIIRPLTEKFLAKTVD